MIIAVSNQKGGVGKTTVAVNLAACFAEDDEDVLVVDADPQASALTWKAQRPDTLPPVQAIGLPSDNLHKEVPDLAGCYDVVIIDAGGQITQSARAAVVAADFVVVPTLPSPPDIASTDEFFETVVDVARTFKDLNAAVLLNQVQRGTRLAAQVLDYVSNTRLAFDAVLHQHVAYREAFGFGMAITEHEPSSPAAADVRNLYQELKQKL